MYYSILNVIMVTMGQLAIGISESIKVFVHCFQKKVSSFYNFERWQEMAILALVKHFELMNGYCDA